MHQTLKGVNAKEMKTASYKAKRKDGEEEDFLTEIKI